MIDADNVVYDYPSGRALRGVSFVVRAGAVLALVGPNGAGKSTLMRCIAALDMPTEGAVTVQGVDTREDPRAIHATLGYLPDIYGLYDRLSVRRCLIYAARSRGVDAAQAPPAAESAAAPVG
jgi:ABC-2 type transport system ATP-binding protein